MFFNRDEAVRHAADLPNKLLTVCNVAGTSPQVFVGHSRAELEREFSNALKAENQNAAMPSPPPHQHSLPRELRLVVKAAVGRLRCIDNDIARLTAERQTLARLLEQETR